ncbi:hypothetical protein C0995_007924, partial [Termitomyces sp. Mi166
MPKFVPKPIVTLASPVAGPSTAPIVSSSAPKPAAAAALSKPAPAKSAGPAVKGGFVSKDPFMVRRFELASMEESRALIINQATEVPATQGTLHSEESGNEDAEGDDVAMNVDSAKQPEETRPVAPIKTVTEVKAPAPALAPVLWVTQQHNAMALYLRDCEAVMNWHETNNVELGDFSDTKDLPVAG